MQIEEVFQLDGDNRADKTVVDIAVDKIRANPFQPRKNFDDESLQELSDSIKEFGVLQPLLVISLEDENYLLIAGERRLKAAKLAQLQTVPVLVGSYTNQQIAEIAMIENLQREDLHYLDEAEGYELIMREFAITQENLAKRIGKKQSTVANKLRILKLDKQVREVLQQEKLSERHARALLKLVDKNQQLSVIQKAVTDSFNVRQTEEYIKNLTKQTTTKESKKEDKRKITKIIRDVRIFINTISKVVKDVEKTGVLVNMQQETNEEELTITLKVPLNKNNKAK